MKFDIVKTIIAIAASLLIAYGLYATGVAENRWLLPIVAFLEVDLFLISAIGINFVWMGTMVNVKIISWLFFVISVVMNIIFGRFEYSVPAYVISNGGIILLFVLLIYSLSRSNK